MRKCRIWMPLYVNDYLGATSHLSTEQHGAYLLLLMHYWRTGEPLPDDDEVLGRVARSGPDRFASLRPVLAKFFQVGDGLWKQKRVEAEMKVAEMRIAKAAKQVVRRTGERTLNQEAQTPPESSPNDAQTTPEGGKSQSQSQSQSNSESDSVHTQVGDSQKPAEGDSQEPVQEPGPTEEEWMETAASEGLTSDEAKMEWHNQERKSPQEKWKGVDRSNLKHHAAFVKQMHMQRTSPGRKNARGGGGSESIWDMRQRIEALRELERKHPANEQSVCYEGDPSSEEIQEFSEIQRKIRELERKLAGL